MTIGPEDSILVADKYNDRVQKLTYDGEFVEEYSVPKPQDVAVDRIGNIYVLSAEDGTVYKFNSVGQYEDKFGGTESEPGVSFGYEGGEELGPYGIACDSQGNVYVSDTYNHRILKFSSDGEFIKMYGSYGHDGDQFAYPKGIYIDNEDNLYVADYGNHRIMRFKLER
jgi:sugar lactone lactonase YvrE